MNKATNNKENNQDQKAEKQKNIKTTNNAIYKTLQWSWDRYTVSA